jgi:hypothetical protein
MSSFVKIRLMGAELFHADEQTAIKKLTVAFRNFAKVPKKPEHDFGRSSPSSAEVKNAWRSSPYPPTCLHRLHLNDIILVI